MKRAARRQQKAHAQAQVIQTPIDTGRQEAAKSARPGAREKALTSEECANTRTSPRRAEKKEVASCKGPVQAASRHGTSEAATDRENSDEEKAHAGPRAVMRNRCEEAVQ